MAKKHTDLDDVSVLFEDDVADVKPNLPPPGQARDEVLAQRKDTLEEAAEKRTEQIEKFPMDPRAFEEDPDIQRILQRFNGLQISGARADMKYVWACCHPKSNDVWVKKSQGWLVVQGDDPEAKEHKNSEDTTRRIGDVLLMRISKAMHDKIVIAEQIRVDKQNASVVAEVNALGDRYRGRGIIVHTDENDTFASGRSVQETIRNRASRQAATQGVDRMIRTGTVPGMPINP